MNERMVKAIPSQLTLKGAGHLPGMVLISQPLCPLLPLADSADTSSPSSLCHYHCATHPAEPRGRVLAGFVSVSGLLESNFLQRQPPWLGSLAQWAFGKSLVMLLTKILIEEGPY